MGFVTASFSIENFEFHIGELVKIISDKALGRPSTGDFEAVGNVVVTYENKALYGEKASVSSSTGQIRAKGNVRYVAADLTIYGSEIFYDLKEKKMVIKDGRIVAENYSFVGKEISKVGDDIIEAKYAEYSTCKDCPESWSVMGNDVRILLSQYIYIKHAFFKVKGVVVAYFPYIVLPIKKKRETGLLYPQFGINPKKGLRYQQPFFWAINPQQDMTFVPSIWGKRGEGVELQYRKVFAEQNFIEINSLQANDHIYFGGKNPSDLVQAPSDFYRQFSIYEHNFTDGDQFYHHFFANLSRDLDILRSFDKYTQGRILGPSLGMGTFVNWRLPLINWNAEAYWQRNLLFPDPLAFDQHYVQVLPKISFSLMPYVLWQLPGFLQQFLAIGIDADFTTFRQNHIDEKSYLRNARRWDFTPTIYWNWGAIGPIEVKSKTTWDYQYYDFPGIQLDSSFAKGALVHESQLAVSVKRIYGLAYQESIPFTQLQNKFREEMEQPIGENAELIGQLPKYQQRYAKGSYDYSHHSYKHGMEFKLKHYMVTFQQEQGNKSFGQQIHHYAGLFDRRDVIRGREHLLPYYTSRVSIPQTNTLEFQWNNLLIQKRSLNVDPRLDHRDLQQNFVYQEIFHFNISQGYQLGENLPLDERLGRLFLSTGANYNSYALEVKHYYFYRSSSHLSSLAFSKKFEKSSVVVGFNYDSDSLPINKYLSVGLQFVPSDLITLNYQNNYDLERSKNTVSIYNLVYSPPNNCWKLDITMKRDLIETDYSVNLMINYNENNFTSLRN